MGRQLRAHSMRYKQLRETKQEKKRRAITRRRRPVNEIKARSYAGRRRLVSSFLAEIEAESAATHAAHAAHVAHAVHARSTEKRLEYLVRVNVGCNRKNRVRILKEHFDWGIEGVLHG